MNELDAGIAAAKKHFLEGRYAEAFRLYEPFAKQGRADCQIFIGWMLYTGAGVAKDVDAALSWFESAAKSDSPEGMFYCGRILSARGQHDKAIIWYRKAAAAGYAPGLFRLGFSLMHGKGVAINETDGIKCLDQAVRAGHVFAARELGVVLLRRGSLKGIARGIWLLFLAAVRLAKTFPKNRFAHELKW